MMKAWTLKTPASVNTRPLLMSDVPTPAAHDDELLVRVSACGICRTDLHVVEGELPERLATVIPGHQIVGRVAAVGAQVEDFAIDDRVGIAWLNRTCGKCRYCLSGRENLCDQALFTGWTVNGGYAEYAIAPASFTYRIPDAFEDIQAAPLLC
ncbi:MAG TPA: alcohol dehydrogenase catalytic domain-containing protein, partial [Nitrospiraceae bacterium]|nr:alcohol dehydrogenase catalytic domain-containing protein [Nitrospiraceae bacterium]